MAKKKNANSADLNVSVPKELSDFVISEAKEFSKTKDGIVATALRDLAAYKKATRAGLYKFLPSKKLGRPLAAFLIFFSYSLFAAPIVNEQKLADAIRIEEGNNPRWLYGIHHKGNQPLSEQEARKRCIQTIQRAERDYQSGDFIDFLALRYCPVNSASWSTNVKAIYGGKQ